MKRFTFLLLLVMLVSTTVWAGARLTLDSGNISGLLDLLEATETSIEGETGSEAIAIFLGEASTEVQTPSLTALLVVSHDSVSTLETITFDASGSLPGDGVITLYEWDLDGDGVFDESSSEGTWEHAYADDGVVFVQSRVTNDLGESAVSEPFQLDIVNQLPTAEFTVSLLGDGTERSLAQFVDSSHDVDGIISSWTWDFGDGTTSNEASPTHTYNSAGLFIATLSVTDDDGASNAFAFEIKVLNLGPFAEFTLQQSTLSVGQPLILTDMSFDQSLDGKIVHVAWDFGDGMYQAGGLSSDNVYSHIFTVAGTYTITLYVIDDAGAMARTQSTVEVL